MPAALKNSAGNSRTMLTSPGLILSEFISSPFRGSSIEVGCQSALAKNMCGTENPGCNLIENPSTVPPELVRRQPHGAQQGAMIEDDRQARGAKGRPPDDLRENPPTERHRIEGAAQVLDVECEMPRFVQHDLRCHRPQHRITRAFMERAEVAFGDHFGQQQYHQLLVQAKQPTEHDETVVAPMALEQRRVKAAQHFTHQSRVLLLLFDEQIDGRRIRPVARGCGVPTKFAPPAALAKLKLLQ